MDLKTIRQEILKHRMQFPISSKRRFEGVYTGKQMYRGKVQFVVGFSWSRPYSHHMSGMVYDRVLGWGDSYDAALEHMTKRLYR